MLRRIRTFTSWSRRGFYFLILARLTIYELKKIPLVSVVSHGPVVRDSAPRAGDLGSMPAGTPRGKKFTRCFTSFFFFFSRNLVYFKP